jgi:hypothetical protein
MDLDFAITGATPQPCFRGLQQVVQQWVLAFVLCPWIKRFAIEITTEDFLAQTGQISFSFYRETDESRDEYQCFGSVIGLNADPDPAIYLDAAQIFFKFHQIFL